MSLKQVRLPVLASVSILESHAEANKKAHLPKSGAANGGNEQKKHEVNGGCRRGQRGQQDELGHPMMKNTHGTFCC
jgi:hypothetical protein